MQPASRLLALRRKAAAPLVESFALVDQADRLSGNRLLAEIEVGDLAFGAEDVEA